MAIPTSGPGASSAGGHGRLARATVAITAGRPGVEPDSPLNPPIVLASTYAAGGPLGYGRYGNATWTALEDALGALEEGPTLSFASGMAAVAAVLDLVPIGGTVLAPEHAYSGSLALLGEQVARGRLGEVRRVDVADTEAVCWAARGADLVWVESPTNPMLAVADLPAIARATGTAGALLAVDNTFATPLVQRPLTVGADLVVASATKYLSGHSDVLLGAVSTRDPGLLERLAGHRSLHGAVPGPVEAWLALRGLRTLAVRMERAQTNAAVLASRAIGHPAVSRVRYPGLPEDPGHARAARDLDGFGAIVCLEVAGGAAAADKVAAGVRLWVNATSLGGVESTLERRRRWAAESCDVPESLLRLSVGCEDVEDLWADLEQALDVVV